MSVTDGMLLSNWSPALAVCPNCEVVMFQPRSATDPNLGFVDIFNFVS